MIIAIGNAPSSGSTYLADLFDSLPFAVCGPEFHLFTPRHYFTDFERVRREGFKRSPTPCPFAAYPVRLSAVQFEHYGTTDCEIAELLASSRTFPEFCGRFFDRYVRYRSKDADLVFEKTPENIHTARNFLDAFPDGVFLHIVRDPLFVFRSLRKRGAPFSVAAMTWLVDTAPAYALQDHPRFYTMKYEELVADPQAAVDRFLDFIGHPRPDQPLEELYRENDYRTSISRAESWSFGGYGKMGNANVGGVDDAGMQAAARYMRTLMIARGYAERFNLPQVTFNEMLDHFGYPAFPYEDDDQAVAIGIDTPSRRRLGKKWVKDFLTTETGISDLPAYLRPVVQVAPAHGGGGD